MTAEPAPSSGFSDVTISPADYEFVRLLLRKEIGFDLGNDRQYLVVNRLLPIAAQFNCPDIGQLIERIRQTQDRLFLQAVVESMTINETSFFRGGQKLFDNLAQVVIPALQRARASQRRLRIWSGACATGQEPYTILITLLEQCPQLRDWTIELVATDISERALEQARNGTYNQFEIQRGLPIQMLLKYFTKTGDRWQMTESLRHRVTFLRHNLLDSFLRLAPPLDIVFLRNVLIYFETTTKTELFQRLKQSLATDGILVLGETESTLGITTDFQLHAACREFYQPASR